MLMPLRNAPQSAAPSFFVAVAKSPGPKLAGLWAKPF